MMGTNGIPVLVLAASVLLASSAGARVRRTPQGIGGLSQSYDFSPSNFNLGASASIGSTLTDFGGLGGLTGLSGLNSGLNFGGSGGGLNYNFDLGGSSNSFGSDFNFPNFGNFPQLGQNKASPSPYIPPVSRVLKEGINAFLPAGAKKILPGDKAYVDFESAISDELPKLEPIIKNIGGKNPFDVIRQTATNPLQTAFTRVIDDPTYSPLPFPKSKKEQTKELTRHVEEELLKVDKQLTAQEKNTQNIYQSIDGISLATSSSKPVGQAVHGPDGEDHESSSSTSNHHQIIPPPENYVSHDGFPIRDDSKLSPFQSQPKITSAISMKQHTVKIPGSVDPKNAPILPPPQHFAEVSAEATPHTIGPVAVKRPLGIKVEVKQQPPAIQVEVKQPSEIKLLAKQQLAVPKPEMVRHLFAKPGVHPQKLQPIGRPEHSISDHNKLKAQQNGHIQHAVSTVSNTIRPTPRPNPEDDFYFGLFQTRDPSAVTKPSFIRTKELLKPNNADSTISEEDKKHSNILQQFGLQPLPKPPQVEATKLLSGAEILLQVKKSIPHPSFPQSGDFSVGPSTTVETVVPPEVKSEPTSEIKVSLSLEGPSEKFNEASYPVSTKDEDDVPIDMVKVNSLDLSKIERADKVSAAFGATPSLEVRDVIDSPDIPVTTSTIVQLQLPDSYDPPVINIDTIDDTVLGSQKRANNFSFNVSADINEQIKRHSNERPETSSKASNDKFIESSVIERPVPENVAEHNLEPRDFTLTVLESPTTPEIQQVYEPITVDVFRLTTEPFPEEITIKNPTAIKYSEELDASHFLGFENQLNNETTERNSLSLDKTSILPSISPNSSNETEYNYSNPYLKSIYEDQTPRFEQPFFPISKSVTRPPMPSSTTERTYPLRTIFPPSKFVSRPTTKKRTSELNNVSDLNLDKRLDSNSEDGLLNLSYFTGKSSVNIPIYKLNNESRNLGIRNSSHTFSRSQLGHLKEVPHFTLEKFDSENLFNGSTVGHIPKSEFKINSTTRDSSVPFLRNSSNVKRKVSTRRNHINDSKEETISLSTLLGSNTRKRAQLKVDTVLDLSPIIDIVKSKYLNSHPNITTKPSSNLHSDRDQKDQRKNLSKPSTSFPPPISRKQNKQVSSTSLQSFTEPIKISPSLEQSNESTVESKKPRREVWSSSRLNGTSVIPTNSRITLQKPFLLTQETSTVLPFPDAQIGSSVSQEKHSPSRLFNKNSSSSGKSSLWPITSFVRYSSNYNGTKSGLNNNAGISDGGRPRVLITNFTTIRSNALPLSPLTSGGNGYREIVDIPSGNNEKQSKELSKFLTMELLKINSDTRASITPDYINQQQEKIPLTYSKSSLNEIPISKELSLVKLSPSTETSLRTSERKELLPRNDNKLSEDREAWNTIANVTSLSSPTVTYTTDTDASISPSLLSKAEEIKDHATPSTTRRSKDESMADSKTISLKLAGFRTEKLLKIV